jgi:hypothetical protein
MTLLNVLFRGVLRPSATDTRGDSSVALILFLTFGLVFAPVTGLQVALAAAGPETPHAETTISPAADQEAQSSP